MRRYRMVGPLGAGRWRATKEMARQDAIRAGCGHRDPMTGLAQLASSIQIEIGDGETDCSEAHLLEGDALAVLVVHGPNAEQFAERQRLASTEQGERMRWHGIAEILGELRAEAVKPSRVSREV